ncbi:MAG: anthranilate synthase component II [Parvibaculales bacterium]
MILIIDNYDSFVHMLGHCLGEIGTARRMVRNDRIDVATILNNPPDAIILSPGPATPQKAGICIDLVKACHGQIPILGICLGHQAISVAYAEMNGADSTTTVDRAPYPAHGVEAQIHHDGHPLFDGIANPFAAARYHSLAVNHPPANLATIARTADGINMALAHDTDRVYGLQFHPESILTPQGNRMMSNFLTLAGVRMSA